VRLFLFPFKEAGMPSVWFLGTTDLPSFLITIISNGLAGMAVSWVIERAPGWNEPPKWMPLWLLGQWPRLKRWFVFVVAVALPTGVAVFAYQAGPEFLMQTGVWGGLAAQGLVMWMGTQVGHVMDPSVLRDVVKGLCQLAPDVLNLIRIAVGGRVGGTSAGAMPKGMQGAIERSRERGFGNDSTRPL
jgi:hypothetical protein